MNLTALKTYIYKVDIYIQSNTVKLACMLNFNAVNWLGFNKNKNEETIDIKTFQ